MRLLHGPSLHILTSSNMIRLRGDLLSPFGTCANQKPL
jgi:hypothetical protein